MQCGKTSVLECYNSGKIEYGDYLGGIVGQCYNANALIDNCYNIGNVENSSYVQGGITGWLSNSTIQNCYNVGNVKERQLQI